MSVENYILISNISAESVDSSFTYSDKNKGAGYNKNNDGMHTVVYSVTDFVGTIKMQATLELYPGEDDWVDIAGTELGGDSSVFSTSQSRTFTGKFLWIRAAYNLQNGIIDQIRYNF
jgi:hypothetical protein